MANIICFGDSITRGENDNEKGGWVDRLKQYYIQKFIETKDNETCVFNMGIGGETTDGLIKRFEGELDARFSEEDPNIITLGYGANDIAIVDGENVVSEDRFKANLTHCVNYALHKGVKIFLVNILPFVQIPRDALGFYGKFRDLEDAIRYNKKIQSITNENDGVELLDVFTLFMENQYQNLLTYDGIHPNSHGHELVYQKVKNVLLK